MFKTSWPIMIVALVAGLVAVLSVSLVAVAQQGPSAARSFDKATVAPGGQVVVTINISKFELGMAVVETLPAGFNYVPGSLTNGTVEVVGTDLQIIPDQARFMYTVTASTTADTYSFGGSLRDLDRNPHTTGGAGEVTVEAPTQQGPSAARLFDKATVAPGGQVVVTINISKFELGMAVVETLPAGFNYVPGSLTNGTVEVVGTDLQIIPDQARFMYTVTASTTADTYSFGGSLRDLDRNPHTTGGAGEVTVEAPTQQGPSAARSFDKATVAPGGQVVVTINISKFELGMAVVETLPAGFNYVPGSLTNGTVEVVGTDLQIIPDQARFMYTVTASTTADTYSFGGSLRDLDRNPHTTGGAGEVTVEAPTQQGPSAARSFDKATVAPGGQVVVTINISNFELGMAVVETLPAGFNYVPGSLTNGTVEVVGTDLQIIPDQARFMYTVTASTTADTYSFGGSLRDLDRNPIRLAAIPASRSAQISQAQAAAEVAAAEVAAARAEVVAAWFRRRHAHACAYSDAGADSSAYAGGDGGPDSSAHAGGDGGPDSSAHARGDGGPDSSAHAGADRAIGRARTEGRQG